MILSKKEKEEQIIKLLHDGIRYKDIAKELHVSPSDISKIKRKITGEEIEDKRNLLSPFSQALKLFQEGKSLADVAILLNMSKDETIKMFIDYLALINMNKVADILKQYRYNLGPFLKWFAYIKENNIRKSDISKAFENIRQIEALTQQKENLQNELQLIEEETKSSLRHYEYVKREINRELG